MPKLLVLMTIAFVSFAACGEDYAIKLVKGADMQTVVRDSYVVQAWEDEAIAGYFKTKDGMPMTVGEVMQDRAGEGGKIVWRVRKVSDAVRFVSVNVTHGLLGWKTTAIFSVNVENHLLMMDNLEAEGSLGMQSGINLLTLMELSP